MRACARVQKHNRLVTTHYVCVCVQAHGSAAHAARAAEHAAGHVVLGRGFHPLQPPARGPALGPRRPPLPHVRRRLLQLARGRQPGPRHRGGRGHGLLLPEHRALLQARLPAAQEPGGRGGGGGGGEGGGAAADGGVQGRGGGRPGEREPARR